MTFFRPSLFIITIIIAHVLFAVVICHQIVIINNNIKNRSSATRVKDGKNQI